MFIKNQLVECQFKYKLIYNNIKNVEVFES